MEMKFYWNNNGHMFQMAAIPVYGKIPLKILYPGTRGMITNTWYVASGTPSHYSLFKLWSWVDLDLFFGKVKFWNLSFYIEKCHSDGFFENFAACDLEIGWYT